MEELRNIESLLHHAASKLKYTREMSKLKGENFNIFSILGIESNENNTHSRFISELLNPRGSHKLGNTFIKRFLESISHSKDFDTETALLKIEKSIGVRNDEMKSGGRIDIAISDGKGNNILIENKIYASDQNCQIERYCNYQTDKSTVYYLTLYGTQPTIESKGELLESEKDFNCISYRNHITQWLHVCIKEANDQPILRETIKQYLLLIKKLTGQLTYHKMNKELKSLIIENLESADIIAKNFNTAKFEILNKIRTTLKENLDLALSDKYKAKIHGKIEEKNSKIWFYNNSVRESSGIYFGIEPFSGIGHTRQELFIGIIDLNSSNVEHFKNDKSNLEIVGWWRGVEYLTFENDRIKLSNLKLLQSLAKDEKRFDGFINDLTNQTIEYINRYEETLLRICQASENASLQVN